MDKTIKPTVLCGAVDAIESKSHAHRLLICAALSDLPCKIICKESSKDIEATAACLRALGASIERTENAYIVSPVKRDEKRDNISLLCGESGSTLRFLLPVAAALGGSFSFEMQGRLANRPLSPLYEALAESKIKLSDKGTNPLTVEGKLGSCEYSLAGNVSSQFVSGLLLASPLIADGCKITLTTKPESKGYIDLTIDVLKKFGVTVKEQIQNGLYTYTVSGSYKTLKEEIKAEGDWSNAVFWLCSGAIGSAPVAVRGLSENSLQPDREIIEILEKFGAELEHVDGKYCVSPSPLTASRVDVRNCPDLSPAIALVASCATGTSTICGAGRLRLKESDRIEAICEMITALGGEAEAFDDEIIIHGTGIVGGVVNSHNDHRIAMSAAIAAGAASEDIVILGAEATEKSYPSFFDDFLKITIV